jgi:hypothetical protein
MASVSRPLPPSGVWFSRFRRLPMMNIRQQGAKEPAAPNGWLSQPGRLPAMPRNEWDAGHSRRRRGACTGLSGDSGHQGTEVGQKLIGRGVALLRPLGHEPVEQRLLQRNIRWKYRYR